METQAELSVKYEGYLKKQQAQVARARAMEDWRIPEDIDYDCIESLRIEARQKLKAKKPLSLSQAGRIPGVNPADVAVLMVWLKRQAGRRRGARHKREGTALKKHSSMALVVFAVCMVSYSGPMVKGALNEGASPISVALLRMLAAALLMLPYEARQCVRRHIPMKLTPAQWGLTALAAAFLAAHYITWITSLTGTSTFASVALVCTQPLFVAFFSYVLFRERTPRRALPGALLALLGAVTIALSGLSGQEAQATGQEALRSNLLALAGAVLMAAHWLAGRQIRQTLAAEVYTPVLYLITAALLALCLPLSGGFRMPLSALPYMAGLVIGSTLLGHAVFAYALSGVSANVISFALLGEPVGAMIFSMIFFGEVPTWPVALGGLLTLMGLALYLAFAGGEKQPA